MARELLSERLAQRLMRRIKSGKYAVGDLLPSEPELAQAEGLSRSTVRAALAVLEKAGMIRRTPHVGTRVISKGKSQNFDRSLSSMSDLDRLASKNPREILDVRECVVSRELAERIQCPPGETYIRFSMVRRGTTPEDPPIAWTTEYVDRQWQDLIAEARRSPELLMIEIIARVKGKHCTEVRQTIEATTLTKEAATNLRAAEGDPCLRIFRRYMSAHGRVLLTTVSYHPADRYAFNLDVRLEDSGLRRVLDES